jgi:positive phototaxis protein PixI
MQSASLSLTSSVTQSLSGEAFLKFQLVPQVMAMVSARLVQEATVIPAGQVTAMPNMPACMLGLINRRGRVIWVANLVRVMGLPLPERSSQQWSLIVVQVGTSPLALQVESIEGIVTLSAETMQPPPAQLNPTILPYLKGCLTHREESVLVLDVEAILQSSTLQYA